MHINHSKAEAKFTGPLDEERVLRKTRHGWRVARNKSTIPDMMTGALREFVGKKIKEVRERQGMTLKECAEAAGIGHCNPKERMWEIENQKRREGTIRLGTLYAIAAALGVEVTDLLPPMETVLKHAGIAKQEFRSVKLSVLESRENDAP